MAKQVQEAYIVAATRTPVGKAPRGMFRTHARTICWVRTYVCGDLCRDLFRVLLLDPLNGGLNKWRM